MHTATKGLGPTYSRALLEYAQIVYCYMHHQCRLGFLHLVTTNKQDMAFANASQTEDGALSGLYGRTMVGHVLAL